MNNDIPDILPPSPSPSTISGFSDLDFDAFGMPINKLQNGENGNKQQNGNCDSPSLADENKDVAAEGEDVWSYDSRGYISNEVVESKEMP